MGAALAVGLALVVGLLGVLVVGLLRSHAEILKALHDLGVNLEDGAPARLGRTAPGVPRPRDDDANDAGPAHDVTGHLPGGGSARAAVVGVEHRTLLAFLSTGCGTCGTYWEALGDPDERALPGSDTRIVIVTQGTETESEAAVAAAAPVDVVTIMSSEAWDHYQVPVAPFFVLVDGPRGRVVGEGTGVAWSQVVDLLGRSVTEQAGPPRSTRANGAERAAAVDDALRSAGILPGDPSLHPAPADDISGP